MPWEVTECENVKCSTGHPITAAGSEGKESHFYFRPGGTDVVLLGSPSFKAHPICDDITPTSQSAIPPQAAHLKLQKLVLHSVMPAASG